MLSREKRFENVLDIHDKYQECMNYVKEQKKGIDQRYEEIKTQEFNRRKFEDRRKQIAKILQAKNDMENSEKLIPWCIVPEDLVVNKASDYAFFHVCF